MTHPGNNIKPRQHIPDLEDLPIVTLEDLQNLAYQDIMNAVDKALTECESCCLDNPNDKENVRDRIAHYVKEIIYP